MHVQKSWVRAPFACGAVAAAFFAAGTVAAQTESREKETTAASDQFSDDAEGLSSSSAAPVRTRAPSRVTAAPARTRAPRRAAGPKYAFPLSGSDFSWREYPQTGQHASGIQAKGYDIISRKWRDDDGVGSSYEENKWTSIKKGVTQTQWETDPKNFYALIYNKAIYAMGDGVVIGCWRNADENPRPMQGALGDCNSDKCTPDGKDPPCSSKAWLNQKQCQGEMAGGGNHLWVRQTDGSYALYAHMIPGTMPASICPHNEKYFSDIPTGGIAPATPAHPSDWPDVHPKVEVINGAHITKGQFLGRVGNSGSSTGPHLHVHMEKGNSPVPIRFERGIASSFETVPQSQVSDPNADLAPKSFAGGYIPVQQVKDSQGNVTKNVGVLVWPARNPNVNYTKYDVEAKSYQSLFMHLADSGMWPGLVTCAWKNGKLYYNVLNWTKAPAGANWYGRHGLNNAQLAAEITKAEQNGYKWTSKYTCNTAQVQNSVVIFKKQ